jgi:crotonobetainyl-CoA:carnitine CoA-transferase CaiB-like acyl-CoA transferase
MNAWRITSLLRQILTSWSRPRCGGAYTDVRSPKFITAALLAAPHHKRRTGQGQYIDVSRVEAPTELLARAILDYTVNGRVQTRPTKEIADTDSSLKSNELIRERTTQVLRLYCFRKVPLPTASGSSLTSIRR